MLMNVWNWASVPHAALQIRLLSSTLLNLFGQYSGEAARVHLALFYIYGIYYQWPKRLTGELVLILCSSVASCDIDTVSSLCLAPQSLLLKFWK